MILWSPSLGLRIPLVVLGLVAWLGFRVARRREWAGASHAVSRTEKATLWRWLAVWGCVLCVSTSASLIEARQREQTKETARVDLTAEVRLPSATWFALIREPDTGHIGLYRRGEPIHSDENPLPLGKIVVVRDDALIIALPTGGSVKVPKGTSLPGPRRLIFVRSALLDTLRFQVRYGATAVPGADYSVVDILGRRAILQRDAIPGEGQAAVGPPTVPGPPRGPRGARSTSGGSPSAPEGATLAELVNRTPFTEVAPDTWEIPAGHVREIGNQVGPLLVEALASVKPSVSMRGGVGLTLSTSLGSGTIDRRGFEIQVTSLARRTGLEVGDRILSVGGEPVNSLGGLISIYQGLKRDAAVSEVNVVVERNNERRTLTYRIR